MFPETRDINIFNVINGKNHPAVHSNGFELEKGKTRTASSISQRQIHRPPKKLQNGDGQFASQ